MLHLHLQDLQAGVHALAPLTSMASSGERAS